MAKLTPHIDRRRARGFTLAEAMVACTVLAVAVIGIASPLITAQQQSETLQQNDLSVGLAVELMEEISSRPYVNPTSGVATLGPSNLTTRSQFVTLGDFNGYTDKTTGLKTAAGAAVTLPEAGVYTRSVHVEYRATPTGASVSSGDFALVQVTVTRPGGRTFVLSRVISKVPYSP